VGAAVGVVQAARTSDTNTSPLTIRIIVFFIFSSREKVITLF
jgi:hypothetical protein